MEAAEEARGSGPQTPKHKALDEAAVAAARPKKARVQQSHEPAMPAVLEHTVVENGMGPLCLLLPQRRNLRARRLAEGEEPEAARLLCPPRALRTPLWRTARREQRTQCPNQMGSRSRRTKLRTNRLRGDSPT